MLKRLLITTAVLFSLYAGQADAQSVSGAPPKTYVTKLFTNTGAWSQVLPADVQEVDVLGACSGGGSGGGGQASANTAGGGGGAGGVCAKDLHLVVTAGATLSGVIGSGGALASAGSNGSPGSPDTTVTGFVGGTTIDLPAGGSGFAGSAGAGGQAAGSAFGRAAMGGLAAATAGGTGTPYGTGATANYSFLLNNYADGLGGGGGGNTAATAGGGGCNKLNGTCTNAAGTGNGAGGGGGDSLFSHGQPGTANGVACSSSPTWVGLGGAGGCGGGTNAAAGPGQAGFVLIGYWTAFP